MQYSHDARHGTAVAALSKSSFTLIANSLLADSPGPCVARQRLESLAEISIEILNLLDGDTDLEDGRDVEPSLGWNLEGSSGHVSDDREHDDCDLEDAADTELNGDEQDVDATDAGDFSWPERIDQTAFGTSGSHFNKPVPVDCYA